MSHREDWIESKNSGKPISKGHITKNVLRPVYADDNKNYSSGKVTKALNGATGIGGTKTYHKHNAIMLQHTPKEDKVRGREKEFTAGTNKLGRKVRVGKMKITRKVSVKTPKIPSKIKVTVQKQGSLMAMLGGIS